LRLTEKGEELLPKARLLLTTVQEIGAMGRESPDDRGDLKISGRPGFLEYVFPLLQRTLQERLPNVRIASIHSGTATEVVEDVRLGRADIGFAAAPGIKSIVAEVIFHDPVWLAVAATHPIARKRKVQLSDLRKLPFCIPLPEDRLRPSINALLRKIGIPASAITETNDYTLMKNLIAESGFAGFVYAHMLLSEGRKRIQPLRLQEFHIARDLTVLHRRDDISPVAARVRGIVIDEAKRILQANATRSR
jgi:DNA-binding transcriptional LysR family regulator